MSWASPMVSGISDQQYRLWEQMLEERTGIHFAAHKSILETGLRRRMRELGCDNLEDYYRRVCGFSEAANQEWAQLLNCLTVRETRFFRHEPSFAAVRRYLQDQWQPDRWSDRNPLRLWSVGCASGEETYSLAMVAAEVAAYVGGTLPHRVLGTDISEQALAVAAAACYSPARFEHLDGLTLNNYFTSPGANGTRCVKEVTRQHVGFECANLARLWEQSETRARHDVVFCQNLLIYFRGYRREQALDALVRSLKPGGLLIVGPGETGGWSHPFLRRLDNAAVQGWVRSPES